MTIDNLLIIFPTPRSLFPITRSLKKMKTTTIPQLTTEKDYPITETHKNNPENKCVLVIDDEEDVRSLIKLGLELQANWTVITASSGPEGVTIAAEKQPDVILLDYMMPDWDGRQTLQKLKANPTTKKIPVILTTAKVQASSKESFRELDIAAIFPKPLRLLQLAEQIMQVINS